MPSVADTYSAGLPLGKTVVLCLDGHAQTSVGALHWAMRHVVRERQTTLHIVTVLPPRLDMGALQPDDYFGWADVAVAEGCTAQAEKGEAAAREALLGALQVTESYKVGNECVTAVLQGEGGASGVGHSLVTYAKANNASVVIVGSRGYGTFKRGLAALAGLGSVSAHCVSELACPVICVKKAEALSALEERPPARLCIAVDNTTHSHQMLQWAADKLLHDHEELHLVTVCQTAMPELNCYPPAVTSDMSTEVARPEKSAERMEVHTVLMREAHRALDKALTILHSHGVPKHRIVTKVLEPEGGASEVGKSLVCYINRQQFFAAVVGNRCETNPWSRFFSHVLLGHSSVSKNCVQHVECPVVVYKHA
eukprot:jgi/Tetstr1/430555/TSEL_020353.t1